MAETWSVISVKKFTYRDAPEEWSNRYHFNGSMPAGTDPWLEFFNALAAEEKKIFSSECSISRMYGYETDAGHAIAQWDYTLSPPSVPTGAYVGGGAGAAPGDAAATFRWETGFFNSRGRKVYLRKYWHDVYMDGTDRDKVAANQVAAYNAFSNYLKGGGLPGGAVLAGPHGVTAGAGLCNPYITTRTLKRRGKRPTP